MTVVDLRKYKELKDNSQLINKSFILDKLNGSHGDTFGLVEQGRETVFTINCQTELCALTKNPDLEMRLVTTTRDRVAEEYIEVTHSYMLYDSKLNKVILSSLKIEDFNTFTISEKDEGANVNGYTLTDLVGVIRREYIICSDLTHGEKRKLLSNR